MMEYTIIQESDFQRSRNKIRANKQPGKDIIFSSKNDELNRKILEKEPINILLISLKDRHDKSKQRDSGFNQVLAKIAKKRSIALGIDLDEIVSANKKEKSEMLSRLRQNIKICNKNKVKMKFMTKQKRNPYDLKSLGLILGMPTWMTKEL